MRPLNSVDGTGVIAPTAEQAGVDHAMLTQHATIAATEHSPAILDRPLGQLPEDVVPIEPPEFVLARKVEETPGIGTVPAGLPGLSGNSAPDANGVLGTGAPDVSALLGDAIGKLAAPVLDEAHGFVGQVQGLSGGVPSVAAGAHATVNSAALPPLPADPVAALMSGLAVPALPGIDVLLEPILGLLGSFGTGAIGAFDPTAILSQSSKVIDMAMQVGTGSMQAVEQLWQGQAARNARVAGQQANVQGQEASQRGIDISELTQRAAAVVEQGNGQLLGVASSFATQATALAPVILTPPAQATLIASATEHLGQAVAIVNATRGDLAGKTAELGGLVSQLLAPGGGPAPQEVVQAVMQNIGEPIMTQAQQALDGGMDTATQAAGLNSGTSITPSSVGTSSGGLGMPGGGNRAGHSGMPGSSSMPSLPKPVGLPGAAVPPLSPIAGMPGTPFGPGGATSPAATNSSYVGGPGAAGQRGSDDDEHSRTVQPYQSRTGNDDLTGPLGESTPDVIGATHSDEIVSSDYEQDQF